jgi:hypothetical protein
MEGAVAVVLLAYAVVERRPQQTPVSGALVFTGVGLLASEPAGGLPEQAAIVEVMMLTVGLSVVLHGVTAPWGARRYGNWYAAAVARNPRISFPWGDASTAAPALRSGPYGAGSGAVISG